VFINVYTLMYYHEINHLIIKENIPLFNWLNNYISKHELSVPNYNTFIYATK